MTRTTRHPRRVRAAAAACAAALATGAGTPAAAQMLDEPFQFKTHDRAGLAALIRSVEQEDERSGSTGIAAGGGGASQTINVCFSGQGESSATGNKECIILNEADGAIQTDQSTSGNQDADNDQSVENNNTELSDAIDDLAE